MKAKYIMIFEDGMPYQSTEITDSDRAAVSDGILEIIDLETCKTFYNDKWNDIPQWGEEGENE